MSNQNPQSRRLWDKGGGMDDVVQRFTVDDDPHWDRHLVYYDCLGSAAHARTLARAGLLTNVELGDLLDGLQQIVALDREGKFDIPNELEDCHTAIEAWLTEHVGPAGEKIHTGRSRNDQVATAVRLYMRDHALVWLDGLKQFVETCLARIDADGDVPMPGYTHMQPAMPSSIGLWLHAFVEAALDQMRAALGLLDRLDGCPLGTGAGFGVSLPLDRAYTARLLGFSRVQRSPIDVQNRRGQMAIYFVRVAVDSGAFLEKLAWDLILFSTAEYGFFTLPAEMTTGSSIMPQKRNPDVLELLRARIGRLRGKLAELEWVSGKLPSNYHRDLQLTKAPVIATAQDIEAMLDIAARVVTGFAIHGERLRAAMRPELYATEAAFELVRAGVPFREAYRRVAADIAAGRFVPPSKDLQAPPAGQFPRELLAVLRNELDDLFHVKRQRHVEAANAMRAVLDGPGGTPADAA